MNATTSLLTEQLDQFGETQLAGASTRDINASTAHLILATVFFTGAVIAIANKWGISKEIYLHTLATFLGDHFGLSNEKATVMIESNARLYKRHVLIERAYNAGWKAANNKDPQTANTDNELKNLLKKYPDLSMTGLNIEGTKEKTVAAAEVEAATSIAPEPIAVASATNWRRVILMTILLALLSGTAYFGTFTNQLSALAPAIESILEQLSEQPLDELLEKILALIP